MHHRHVAYAYIITFYGTSLACKITAHIKVAVKININTEGLQGIWTTPGTLDSLSVFIQFREELEDYWQHVKVVFQNKLNHLMLCSWWWKTLRQVLLSLFGSRDMNIFMHRKSIQWAVGRDRLGYCLGSNTRNNRVYVGSFEKLFQNHWQRFACNEICPTRFQLTLVPSFIKLSCPVWQLYLYTGTHVTISFFWLLCKVIYLVYNCAVLNFRHDSKNMNRRYNIWK